MTTESTANRIDPMTAEEEKWLDESGRMVRFVVVDKSGKRRMSQGIGIPKTSIVIGKARNGQRLPIVPIQNAHPELLEDCRPGCTFHANGGDLAEPCRGEGR